MARVVLYTTSVMASANLRSAENNLKHILKVKGVPFEEVDLAMYPRRRDAMLEGSDGNATLPQLHVDGKFVGTADEVQEMEDFGELDAVLKPAAA